VLGLFRRAIGERERVLGAPTDRRAVRRRQLRPENPDPFSVVHHDDRIRAEPAVHEAVVMKRLERFSDPDGDAQRGRCSECTAGVENVTQRRALDPLQGDEKLACLGLAGLVDALHPAQDVGRCREGEGLRAHRRHEFRVAGKYVSQDLQRDRTALMSVLGAVDDHVVIDRRDGVDAVSRSDD
jgi:hypothetical protein